MSNPAANPDNLAIGERVICVDHKSAFHRVTEGAIYTVIADFSGWPIVEVNGAYLSLTRFKRTTT